MTEDRGVIYVLTNPSFPEYVKIGYADNLEKRLNQLNRSECLPFAFRAYCVYEVNNRLKDKDVHNLIDKLNPDLRAIETFDGKPRIREFYNISAEDAYEILSSISAISGTEDKLRKVDPVGHEITDEAIALDVQESTATYLEKDLLIRGSTATRFLYEMLKERILALEGVNVEPKKLYIAFKNEMKKNICDVEIQKGKLKVYINLLKGKLYDPDGLAEDVSDVGHWGNGDYRISISDENEIDYAIELIAQSYHKNCKKD